MDCAQYTPPAPAPAPLTGTKKDKSKTKEVEVLNPKGVAAAEASSTPSAKDDDDAESELPEMTPSLVAFSKIPHGDFARSFEYIQNHREVVVPGASDALLVAGFTAEGEGKPKYAKQCVHQSLLLQYCEKLGGDGVRVFFGK